MKSAGSRRLANWRSPYRGLLAPDRSGDGELILDWNPRAGGRMWAAWFFPVLACGSLCASVLLFWLALEDRSVGFLAFSAITLGTGLLLSSASSGISSAASNSGSMRRDSAIAGPMACCAGRG